MAAARSPSGPTVAAARVTTADPWPAIMREFAGVPADLVPVLQRTQEAFGYLSPDAVLFLPSGLVSLLTRRGIRVP